MIFTLAITDAATEAKSRGLAAAAALHVTAAKRSGAKEFITVSPMLTSQKTALQLPEDDLVYLAFRLAIQRSLLDLRELMHLKREPSLPTGFLTAVPYLAGVPLRIQTDLLAETWAHHIRAARCDASLLDAAVLYAVFRMASRLAGMRDLAEKLIGGGPRRLDLAILDGASERLQTLFYGFWKYENFLWLHGVEKIPQDHLFRRQVGLTASDVQPMHDAIGRTRVSPNVAAKLEGLLKYEEIENAVTLLASRDLKEGPGG